MSGANWASTRPGRKMWPLTESGSWLLLNSVRDGLVATGHGTCTAARARVRGWHRAPQTSASSGSVPGEAMAAARGVRCWSKLALCMTREKGGRSDPPPFVVPQISSMEKVRRRFRQPARQ